jgi:hypothetical protein
VTDASRCGDFPSPIAPIPSRPHCCCTALHPCHVSRTRGWRCVISCSSSSSHQQQHGEPSSTPHEQRMLHVGGQQRLKGCLSLDGHARQRAAVVEAKVWNALPHRRRRLDAFPAAVGAAPQTRAAAASCYRPPIFALCPAGIRGLARDLLLLCFVVSLFHSTINIHARPLHQQSPCLRRQPLTDRFFRTTPILTSRVSLRPNSSTHARLA